MEQVVATNVDYVFIVSSLIDLAPDFSAPLAEVQKTAPNVPVYAVSSHTGSGLDGLSEYLQPGKIVVFLGMSGVGKYLFKSSWKKRYTDRGIRKILSKYSDEAGLVQNLSPHKLHHFLLTRPKKQGIDDAR
ncbi:hypothetical protein [Paenibacillus elgii]|uniref:hypothetical protein n=1 Tax=Paenibacillus elgii TaxID=189691 RepID=UPI00241540BF|nr:hypothetical protein [Paenibacillus elgii]